MARPIPSSSVAHTYRLATGADLEHARAGRAGALLAFADDVLDLGDARLALARVFRWDYCEADGKSGSAGFRSGYRSCESCATGCFGKLTIRHFSMTSAPNSIVSTLWTGYWENMG
jgi:hypothetical protein